MQWAVHPNQPSILPNSQYRIPVGCAWARDKVHNNNCLIFEDAKIVMVDNVNVFCIL